VAAGRTHDLINLAVLPVAVYYLQPENFTGFAAGYLIGTFFLSPDNDVYHSKPNRRWKFLRFLWLPYTRIFSHRGVSHTPILGSFIKVIYLILVLFVLACIVAGSVYLYDSSLLNKVILDYRKNTDWNYLLFVLKHPFTVSFLIGLFLAEIVHIATDVIYSTAKRLRLIR